MDFITYRATFPAVPTGTDVVSQEFSVEVDGTPQPLQVLASDATSADFEAKQDSSVVVELVNVDDAGNRSIPQRLAFTAIDTFAPAQPGEISVEATGERTVPDA